MKKKMVSTSLKISCPLARISSFLKNCFPAITINDFRSQKNISDQKTMSPLDKNSVFNSRVKDLVKIRFHYMEKLLSLQKYIYIYLKKMLSTSRNMVCL